MLSLEASGGRHGNDLLVMRSTVLIDNVLIPTPTRLEGPCLVDPSLKRLLSLSMPETCPVNEMVVEITTQKEFPHLYSLFKGREFGRSDGGSGFKDGGPIGIRDGCCGLRDRPWLNGGFSTSTTLPSCADEWNGGNDGSYVLRFPPHLGLGNLLRLMFCKWVPDSHPCYDLRRPSLLLLH